MVYIPRALYCVTWPIAFIGIGFVKHFFAQLTDSTVVCFQYDIVGQFFCKKRAKKIQCAALLLAWGLDSFGSNNRKPCQRSALWHNRSKRIEGFKRSADAMPSVTDLAGIRA